MLVVLSLGNNALLQPGDPFDSTTHRGNIRAAAQAVAAVARQHQVVLTHGNGPQIGLLGQANMQVTAYPLDVVDSESQGMVGYLLEQELGRRLPGERLATLLTQVLVDPADPAFRCPTKAIGPRYDEVDARRIAKVRNWTVAPDGTAWRWVVPSPEPQGIIELATVRILVDHGILVTCLGGGGIPVVPDAGGGLRGVEAVIDKDLSAALLATGLGADALVLLTDVDAAYDDWGAETARPVGRTSVAELRRLGLTEVTMAPKVEALCRFVDAGGRVGAIGALSDALALVRGEAGTVVHGRSG